MKHIYFTLLVLTTLFVTIQCKEDTPSSVFTAETKAADSVTANSAKLVGEVNPNNLSTVVTFEWGLTTAYGNSQLADLSPVQGNSIIKLSCMIDSLLPETEYHYRIVASNSSGTIYGTDISFTTTPIKFELPLIHTGFGNILIWLYDQTPLHKANFLSLTKSGFYDSLTFHRVVANFVIQGGDPLGNGTGGPGYTIAAEFNDSLTHIYGAVGAARNNNPEKRSSGSQFYIVVNKAGTHFLDKNYTVFGIVIDGMTAADAISLVPNSGSPNNTPLSTVYMTDVELVSYSAAELKSLYNFTIPTF